MFGQDVEPPPWDREKHYTPSSINVSTIQYSPFIMLYLWSICPGMDCVISEPCYKGTILQRNYKKMTI